MAEDEQIKTSWDLSLLFDGDDDPAIEQEVEELQQAAEEFANKWQDREDYLNDSQVLLEALNDYEAFLEKHDGGGAAKFYFKLRHYQNLSDNEIKARHQQMTELWTKVYNKIQFFELSLGKISKDKQEKFLEDNNLSSYHHFLSHVFREGKYRLSHDQEKIMNLKAVPAHSKWTQMSSEFIANTTRKTLTEDGSQEMLSFEEVMALTSNKQKSVRDKAGDAFNSILDDNANVATHELNAVLYNKKIDDELRGFERPDSSRRLTDDVSNEMVDSLIKAVTEHNNVAQRFYQLKADILDQKQLAYYERNVSVGAVDLSYSHEEAIELVGQVLKKLDKQFNQIYREFIVNGQIDFFPKQGKRGGAFCTCSGLDQPTYIMMNFTSELGDVTTLAHEVGHGIHNELMRPKQPSLYFGVSMATAETASQFLEDFVLDDVVAGADKKLQLAIMMQRLNSDISSVFRQIACYKFEQELHENFREQGNLSRQEIGELFQEHMQSYMGDAFKESPGFQLGWVYWSHIRNFFYNYSYASGLLIAKFLQKQVRKDPEYINKVKKFLEAGYSQSPRDIFQEFGIDITDEEFWTEGLEEIKSQLKEAEDLAEELDQT